MKTAHLILILAAIFTILILAAIFTISHDHPKTETSTCIKVSNIMLYDCLVYGYVDTGSAFYNPQNSFVGYVVKRIDGDGKTEAYIYARTEKEIQAAIISLIPGDDNICDKYNKLYPCND